MIGKKTISLLLIASSGWLALSCSRKEAPKPDVIFLLLDALRADRLGCYGHPGNLTPALDRLGAEGTVFRNNFSNATYTRASVPSYFYSRYFIKSLFPADRRLPLEEPADLFRALDPEAISLGGLFKANGYHTVLFSAHPWFVRGYELVGDFDEFYQVSGRGTAHGDGADVASAVREWIAENGAKNRPYFIYVHFMDTHFPHEQGKDPARAERFDWRGYFQGQEMGKWGLWWLGEDFTEADREYLDSIYNASVSYADRAVGSLVSFLEEDNLLDRTLLLVTADHGEHLGEHGLTEHGGPPWDSVIRVPLVMRLPGTVPAGKKVDSLVELADLSPTLVKLLGLKVPPGKSFDGTDAFGEGGRELETVLGKDFIRTREYKYFLDPDGVAHLYDLKADPGELRDLAPERPGEAESLVRLMERMLLRSRRRYQASRASGPPELPFAVSADFFELTSASRIEQTARYSYPGPGGEIALLAAQEPVWIHNRIPGRYYVLGRNSPNLRPLEVSFPVPDGTYRLGVGCLAAPEFAGGRLSRFRLALGGPEGEKLEVAPAASGKAVVELGNFTVTGGVFRAVVFPEPAPDWSSLLYFGFELAEGGAPKARDEEEDRRMRDIESLGYMN